jgi:hypothetical protein
MRCCPSSGEARIIKLPDRDGISSQILRVLPYLWDSFRVLEFLPDLGIQRRSLGCVLKQGILGASLAHDGCSRSWDSLLLEMCALHSKSKKCGDGYNATFSFAEGLRLVLLANSSVV